MSETMTKAPKPPNTKQLEKYVAKLTARRDKLKSMLAHASIQLGAAKELLAETRKAAKEKANGPK